MSETWQGVHDWGALTRAEIAAARDAGALPVLTVGSVEQHADHLPVDTDTLSAHRVRAAGGRALRQPACAGVAAAVVRLLATPSRWAGTITLSLETFVGMVTDVAESLHRTGFKRLLIVNGHGGNQGPLTSACTALASRGLEVGFVNYFSPGQKQWMEVLPGALRGVGHACAYETALQLSRARRRWRRRSLADRSLPPRLTLVMPPANAPDVLKPAGAYWRRSSSPAMWLRRRSSSGDEGGDALVEQSVAALAQFYATSPAPNCGWGRRRFRLSPWQKDSSITVSSSWRDGIMRLEI